MRITRVEPIVLRLPEIELRADGTQDAFLVRIETDEGLYGIGEADTAPAVARAAVEMPASHMIAQGLGELLVGRDPLDIEPIWHDLYEKSMHFGHRGVALHAMSAIDIALYDLAGKILGQPVHRLLGGAVPRPRAGVRLRAHAVDARRACASSCRPTASRATAPSSSAGGRSGRTRARTSRSSAAAREACGPDLDADDRRRPRLDVEAGAADVAALRGVRALLARGAAARRRPRRLRAALRARRRCASPRPRTRPRSSPSASGSSAPASTSCSPTSPAAAASPRPAGSPR